MTKLLTWCSFSLIYHSNLKKTPFVKIQHPANNTHLSFPASRGFVSLVFGGRAEYRDKRPLLAGNTEVNQRRKLSHSRAKKLHACSVYKIIKM